MLYLGASPTEILWKGTKAPVFNRKQLCALLIPLRLEQILASLMGMADTMMVSNVGSHAIAAVSLVDSLNIVNDQPVFRHGHGRLHHLLAVYRAR